MPLISLLEMLIGLIIDTAVMGEMKATMKEKEVFILNKPFASTTALASQFISPNSSSRVVINSVTDTKYLNRI